MARRHDPRRARAHRTYDAVEVAQTFNVTIGTVHAWRKWEGLQSIDGKRPYLFSGSELARFLQQKNAPRQRLEPGEIFCVACKAPRKPKDSEARVKPKTATSVELIGECPVCGRDIYRRTRIAELREKAGNLDLRYEDGSAPLSGDSDAPRIDSCEESEE